MRNVVALRRHLNVYDAELKQYDARLRASRNLTVVPDSPVAGALKVIQELMPRLPKDDIDLLTPSALAAMRSVRKHDPQIWLLYRGQIRDRCGRYTSRMLDEALELPETRALRKFDPLAFDSMELTAHATWVVKGLFSR